MFEIRIIILDLQLQFITLEYKIYNVRNVSVFLLVGKIKCLDEKMTLTGEKFTWHLSQTGNAG